jgi:hypothetical protein
MTYKNIKNLFVKPKSPNISPKIEPTKSTEEATEDKLIRLVEERVRYSLDMMIRSAIDKEMEKIEETVPRPHPDSPEEYQRQIMDNLLQGAVPETPEQEEVSTKKFVAANPKLFDHP